MQPSGARTIARSGLGALAMLKFFRVHRTKLLVFFGAILMVLFLLPQAWQSLGPNPLDQVAFRIDGRNFTGRDFQHAQARFQVLSALEQTSGVTVFRVLAEEQSSPIEHWMMLVYEARKQGLVGGGAKVDELLAALADIAAQRFTQLSSDPTQAAQYTAQMREAILTNLDKAIEDLRARLGPEVVESAVSEIYGVQRLLGLSEGFTTFSSPEIDSIAVEFLDTAVGDLALVGSIETLSGAPDPTAEQLAAHFEQFKDAVPAADGSTMGYRLPPAVQLEAIDVDLARVRAALTIDEIEVNKRWRQNKATYGEDFGIARDRVESDIRDERLEVIVRALEEVARRELFKETRDLASDGVWKKLPANWAETRVSFGALAEAFNNEIAKSVTLPAPAASVLTIDTWETEANLNTRSIGRSFAMIRGEPVGLPTLAMNVRELAPESNSGVQVGLAIGPLLTPRERLAYVRVLEARPAGPPASIDEVRDRVIADWKKLSAYEALVERTDEIRGILADAGRIDALLATFPRTQMQVGIDITRGNAAPTGGAPATVANTQAMRDAIMDVVAKWDPTIDATSVPMADRVVVVPLPDQFGVGAAVITGRYPVSREMVRTYMPQLMSQYSFELTNTGQIQTPYSFERLKERLGYSAPQRSSREPDESETEPPTQG